MGDDGEDSDDPQERAPVSIVPSVAWIRRGVPKSRPERVKLSKEELRQLIENEGDSGEAGESASEEDSESEGEENAGKREAKGGKRKRAHVEEGEGAKKKKKKKVQDVDEKGSRGSAKKKKKQAVADEEDEEEQGTSGTSLGGLACFSSSADDPYITRDNGAASSDDDREDFELQPDDNLLAVAHCEKDECTLEIRVFNEKAHDFYVHHDYMLAAPPLCLEAIGFDPGASNLKGNLLAIGSMDPAIEIWDLDLVDSMEPVVMLGEHLQHKKAKKKKKKGGNAKGHTDAVLALAWNSNTDHVFASGSADKSVLLWDLETAEVATVLPPFNDKVQSVRWHNAEASLLICGSTDGSVRLTDCRHADTVAGNWQFANAEVEQLLWDRFAPFYFLVATDDGQLSYCDSRKPNFVLHSTSVYNGDGDSTSIAFDQNHSVKGMFASSGGESVKIWEQKTGGFNLVHEFDQLHLGTIHCVSFNPDSPSVLAVGGQRFRLVHLDKVDVVKRKFGL